MIEPSQPAPPSRIRALQHPLDRVLYHPLADRLARMLVHTAVTPTMVSFAGGLAVVLAGVAYIQPWWPWSVLAGLLIHMSWHVFDGADGALARMTGRAGPAGEAIDGACDYAGHAVLYLALAIAWLDRTGWWIIALGSAAAVSRIVQANFYEVRRRQFMAWVHGVPWLRSADVGPAVPLRGLVRAYLWLGSVLTPDDPRIDRLVADPLHGAPTRAALEALGPSQISGSSLLGANIRTLALGAAMAAGSPVWYFLYEIVVLNLVLVLAIGRSRQALDAIRPGNQGEASTLR